MGTRRNVNNIEGMKRFGINSENAFGIPTPDLAAMAREIGRDQALALDLWDTGFHEARIMAAMVAVPERFTPGMMDSWCEEFDSWDVCDQVCMKVFRYSPHARDKIAEWAVREEEFVRRAAFALIATLSVSDKSSPDELFEPYFEFIVEASTDERNFVKKAVNWALRQLGKRNQEMWYKAIGVAEELMLSRNKTARWIGTDATRDLTGERALKRAGFR